MASCWEGEGVGCEGLLLPGISDGVGDCIVDVKKPCNGVLTAGLVPNPPKAGKDVNWVCCVTAVFVVEVSLGAWPRAEENREHVQAISCLHLC